MSPIPIMLPKARTPAPVPPARPWWSFHARVAAAVTTAAAVAAAVFGSPPLPAQLAALVVGVALLGVPHGALDHLLGRALLRPRLGDRWPIAFGLAYLGLATVVIVSWWLAPVASLVAFLALSAVHFGLGDTRPNGTRALFAVEVAVRGSLPILLPTLFHTREVTRLFGWLVGNAAALSTDAVIRVAGATALALAPAMLWLCVHHFRRWLTYGRAEGGEVLLEISTLVGLFWLAPPLISFLFYFCAWHSLRHTLETSEALIPGKLKRALGHFALLAAPLTAATLVLAISAWSILRATGMGAEPAILRVVFVGLAALTVPHMVLCAMAQTRPRGL
ncbi:MAG: Brp/Blh family beta-carotene 15,15'-dioxygenase [Acidobacteriota bacterium]